MKQRVLVLGNGGREDAMVNRLVREGHKVYAIPGNAGTKKIGINVPIDLANLDELARFARNNVHVTIVGPETILNQGIVDRFKHERIPIFGPGKFATQLEADKLFGKLFMEEYGIPTAEYEMFQGYEDAMEYVRKNNLKKGVVKANGLASGKGVFVCKTRREIESALYRIMVKQEFGCAGNIVLIEKLLSGRELSLMVFYDGRTFKMFPLIQDHKRAHDNDKGPNTGGMGAIGPLTWVSDDLFKRIKQEIVIPTMQGLKDRNMPYAGCLYFGLMMTKKGPMVLEYNVRLGDPEAQVAMALLGTSFLKIVEVCIAGKLSEVEIDWKKKYAVCLVLASEGYPAKVKDAKKEKIIISGIEEAEKISGVYVNHSGTERLNDLYTFKGKRVLSVTAIANTKEEARALAYRAAKLIKFDGKWCREDIGIESSW
ncbi:MAG: phosphoribosylamine--glycine ligase [Candidatus Paceibacterota bacterium]|jgi:phosphoribosylamine--glycine ligase